MLGHGNDYNGYTLALLYENKLDFCLVGEKFLMTNEEDPNQAYLPSTLSIPLPPTFDLNDDARGSIDLRSFPNLHPQDDWPGMIDNSQFTAAQNAVFASALSTSSHIAGVSILPHEHHPHVQAHPHPHPHSLPHSLPHPHPHPLPHPHLLYPTGSLSTSSTNYQPPMTLASPNPSYPITHPASPEFKFCDADQPFDVPTESPSNPGRTKSACLRCHEKKQRCDDEKPCWRCKHEGVECVEKVDSGKKRSGGKKA